MLLVASGLCRATRGCDRLLHADGRAQLQHVCERTSEDMFGSNKREAVFGWGKMQDEEPYTFR
jgi:hypothetical protein